VWFTPQATGKITRGDFLSTFSGLDPPCFAKTGAPRVGCDLESRTDGLWHYPLEQLLAAKADISLPPTHRSILALFAFT